MPALKCLLAAAYWSEIDGRSIDKLLGTVTTVNKHSLIIGDQIRALSLREQIAAQTFADNRVWPKSSTLTKLMNGNAVGHNEYKDIDDWTQIKEAAEQEQFYASDRVRILGELVSLANNE